jgi:hypothetical protein
MPMTAVGLQANSIQGQIYEQALGGKALLISPQGVPP